MTKHLMKRASRKKAVSLGLVLLGAVGVTAGAVYAGTTVYTYDDAGRLTDVDYGNGVIVEYEYDDAGNRTKLTVTGRVL